MEDEMIDQVEMKLVIKLKDGKEVSFNENDARLIYGKLKSVFEPMVSYPLDQPITYEVTSKIGEVKLGECND